MQSVSEQQFRFIKKKKHYDCSKMLRILLLLSLSLSTVVGHDEYIGKCPDLKPMQNFDWEKFRTGRWYAMEKFDTSSKCLTYDFIEDSSQAMYVEQRSTLTGLARLSFDNKAIYKGRLVVPSSSEPASMIVRFPLSLLGTASFIILDTDYENYGLVCTCQSTKIFIELFTFHRRSCTILQRRPTADPDIIKKLHGVLNKQIPAEDGDEEADHDFDVISHKDCDYSDSEKGIQINVDKIIGATQGEKTNSTKDYSYEEIYGDYQTELQNGNVEYI